MNMVVMHPAPDLLEAAEVVDAAAVTVAVEEGEEDAAVVIAVVGAVVAAAEDVAGDMVETKADMVEMAATEG